MTLEPAALPARTPLGASSITTTSPDVRLSLLMRPGDCGPTLSWVKAEILGAFEVWIWMRLPSSHVFGHDDMFWNLYFDRFEGLRGVEAGCYYNIYTGNRESPLAQD